MGPSRVLFLGQKPFGEAAWERLRRVPPTSLSVVAVVTNLDASRVWWGTRAIADSSGDILRLDNAERDTTRICELIDRLGIDLLLSVQHPWVLPPDVLTRVRYAAINFHNAALPDYKGHNAVNHALLARASRFTCTVHWMADEVDAGDIALECSFAIAPDETALSLYAKAHHAGLRLFDEVLSRLRRGETLPRRPVPSGGTFYRRDSITPLRQITDPADHDVKGRAFYFPPFEPAYVCVEGRRLYVLPEDAWRSRALLACGPRELLNDAIRRTEGVELALA